MLPTVLVVLGVRYDPELSPLDEVAHLDYLDRAADWSYPRMGDRVSTEIATLAKCRSLQTQQGRPVCQQEDVHVEPDDVVPDGYSYQAQHPPLYYWTSAAAERITSLGPADNLITSGRLTGAFWLSAGSLCLYFALRRLGVGLVVSCAACALLIAAPGILASTSKITNDATSLLAGAGLLLAYTFVRNDPRVLTVAALAVTSGVLTTLKAVNILAVGAICVVAAVELIPRLGWPRGLAAAAAPGLVGVGAVLGWMLLTDAQATVDPDQVMAAVLDFKQKSEGPPVGQFIFSSSRLLTAFDDGAIVTGRPAAAVAAVGRFAVIGTAVAATLGDRRRLSITIAAAALAVTIAAGLAFNVQFWLDHELRGGPASRYGLSVLPLLVTPLALLGDRSTRSRVGVVLLALLVGTSTIIGVVMT
ncbi:MAG: hypothetical protein U5K30_09140 [Acidimicrobiales bacterium]|nr:hypothetical protein [Acidimicrobiales bacterium]